MTTITENNRYEWIATSGLTSISTLDTETQESIRNDFINKIFQFRDTVSATAIMVDQNLDLMIPTNGFNVPIGRLKQPVHFVTNAGVVFGSDPDRIEKATSISATQRFNRNDWDEIYQVTGQNYGVAEHLDYWLPKGLTLSDPNSQLVIHHHVTDERLFYVDGIITTATNQDVRDHPDIYELAVRDKLSLTLTTDDDLTESQITDLKQTWAGQMSDGYGEGTFSRLADSQSLFFVVEDTQA